MQNGRKFAVRTLSSALLAAPVVGYVAAKFGIRLPNDYRPDRGSSHMRLGDGTVSYNKNK